MAGTVGNVCLRHVRSGSIRLIRGRAIRVTAAILLSVLWMVAPGSAHASGSWITLTSHLTNARYVDAGSSAPCLNSSTQQCVYAIAGNTTSPPLSSVEFADPSTGANPAWTVSGHNINTLNQTLYSPAATTGPCPDGSTDRCIYVAGGSTTGNIGAETADVEVIDPSSGVNPSWSSTLVPDLTNARYDAVAVSAPCPGTLGTALDHQCTYVIGGYAGTPGGPISSVEFLDPAVSPIPSSWTPGPSLPTAVYSPAAATAPCPGTSGITATARLCIYVIGGNSGGTDQQAVQLFDPHLNAWSATTALTNGRVGNAAWTAPCPGTTGHASDLQCVYTAAGDSVDGKNVEILDPHTGPSPSWVAGPSLNAAQPNAGAATAPCPASGGLTTDKQCLYIMGGGNTPALNTVEVLDPTTVTTRSLLSALRVQRHGDRLLVSWRVADTSGIVGFNVYVGGHRANRHLIVVHRSPSYRAVIHTSWAGHVSVRPVFAHSSAGGS